MRSYYEILGVSKSATTDEIKTAYRNLARRYHPDRNPDDKDAEEAFKEIGEAWQVLRDPESRRRYDLLGLAPAGSQFGDALTPSDWSWGNFARRVARRAADRLKLRRGKDIKLDVQLSFEEAALGCERVIRLPRAKTEAPDSPIEMRELSFNLPGGLVDGQPLKWRGQGEPGEGGGPPGDLELRVRVTPDSEFKLDGVHVRTPLHLTLYERLSGGRYPVRGLEGVLVLQVPQGVAIGAVLRLQGQGARPRRGRAGDLLVEIRAYDPSEITSAQLVALRSWEIDAYGLDDDDGTDDPPPEAPTEAP